MTDAEMIAELERLNAERTQGEWARLEQRSADPRFYIGQEIRGPDPDPSSKYEWPPRICQSVVGQIREEGDRADFAFIAAVANALPRLLALAKELERERVLCQSWHDDAIATQKMLMEANETNARLTAANKALVEAAGPFVEIAAVILQGPVARDCTVLVFASDIRALSRAVEAASPALGGDDATARAQAGETE